MSSALALAIPGVSFAAGKAPFCDGLSRGECLTVVIGLASPGFENDPGMNALAYALSSSAHARDFRRACDDGLAVWLRRTAAGKRSRARDLFGRVKRSRCLLRPASAATPKLPATTPEEMGLHVRMVGFDVTASAWTSASALGDFTFEGARVESSFRDPRLAPAAGGRDWTPAVAKRPAWSTQPYRGVFETTPFGFPFGRRLTLRFDGFRALDHAAGALGDAIDDVLAHGPDASRVGASLASFRAALDRVRAGDAVGGSLALVALGLDALRSVCRAGTEDCRLARADDDVAARLDAALGAGAVLDADAKATLLDALAYYPSVAIETFLARARWDRLLEDLALPAARREAASAADGAAAEDPFTLAPRADGALRPLGLARPSARAALTPAAP